MSSPDRTQLPHLLALLDDESGVVRDSVLSKLAEPVLGRLHVMRRRVLTGNVDKFLEAPLQ